MIIKIVNSGQGLHDQQPLPIQALSVPLLHRLNVAKDLGKLQRFSFAKLDSDDCTLLGWACYYKELKAYQKVNLYLAVYIRIAASFALRVFRKNKYLKNLICEVSDFAMVLAEEEDFFLRQIEVSRLDNPLVGLALSLMHHSQSKNAKEYFELALNSREKWIKYQDQGFAFFQIKEYLKAIDALKKSSAINENWKTCNVMAFSYLSINHRSNKAMEILEKSIQLNRHWSTYAALGSVKLKCKQFDHAIDLLRKSIKLKESWSTYNDLGWAYKGKKDSLNAISAFHKSISINPFNWMSRRGIGSSLIQQENYAEAIFHIKLSIWLWQKSWRTHRDLGVCYFHEKKYKAAISAFRKSNAIHNTWKNTRDIAISCLAIRNYNGAQNAFVSLLETRRSWDILYNLGYAYMKLGRWDESVKIFEESFSLKKNQFTVNALAWIYFLTSSHDRLASIMTDYSNAFGCYQVRGFISLAKGNPKKSMRLFKKELEALKRTCSSPCLGLPVILNSSKKNLSSRFFGNDCYILKPFSLSLVKSRHLLSYSYRCLEEENLDDASMAFIVLNKNIRNIFCSL